MRVRVPHTYDFGEARAQVGGNLVTPSGWDTARTVSGAFALPANRSELERLADQEELSRRAAAIVAVATARDARILCSHAIGVGALELRIRMLAPALRMICTEYAPRTVDRLRELFPDEEILLRDLTAPDPPQADLHLMHRLDAELSDQEWRQVFAAIPAPILFVPNVVLGLGGALRELARPVLRLGRVTRAGWFRNESALRALWASTHRDARISIGSADAFLLEPR